MSVRNGFTLLELMITLAILAIVVTLAAPPMSGLVYDNRLTTTANAFVADLNLARSEAMKRGTTVVVCRTDTPFAAAPVCGSGTNKDWAAGYVIFVDENGNDAYDNGIDVDVRIGEPLEGTMTLVSDTDAQTLLSFNRLGGLDSEPADGVAELALCDHRGSASRRLIQVGLTGRPALAVTDGSCTP